ncbi:Nucleobindin-1 [Peltigera leucophlebia]|nr:Nucleobindin-1 [Peltigera leucophlebia]
MEKSVPVSSTPVPPYESNPQYGAPPPVGYSQHAPQPVMQQDSYQIHQATGPQGQHPQPIVSPQGYPPQEGYQQQGVASPHGDIKQEGYFTPIQQQQTHPIGQQQPVLQQQQQQQQPLQPQQSQYRVGVPLSNLQDTAAPVDCPQCGTRAMTNISFESGNTTQ